MDDHSTADRLSSAASLLDAVAADRDRVTATVAVECLFAVEQLERSGARLLPLAPGDTHPRARLRVAMQELAALDDDTLSGPSVIEAARAARHAYRQLA